METLRDTMVQVFFTSVNKHASSGLEVPGTFFQRLEEIFILELKIKGNVKLICHAI